MDANPIASPHSTLLDDLVHGLAAVAGVQAIVLGGSRALGTHTPESDLDLGLYYDPSAPLDMAALREFAAGIDDRRTTDVITPLGEWGPWINGGGWLKVRGMPVDLLYRDLVRVGQVIDECCAGRVEIHYQPGHPHGFSTAIYMGEIAACKILWDPQDRIAALKARAAPYPAPLRQAVINKFLWEARFSIDIARKSVYRADVAYAAGCCFRGVACLIQVLFALNGRYLLNEKGALAMAATFALCPPNLRQRTDEVFSRLDAEATAIEKAVTLLELIVSDVETLASS